MENNCVNSFNLYYNESQIASDCNELIDRYYRNVTMREQDKKKHEIFHLLTLIDMKCINFGYKIKEVLPHEPGDAIIIDSNNEKHLVEIFRVIGDEENKQINKLMNNIFNNNISHYTYYDFKDTKMKNLFLSKLEEKNNKDYLKDSQYKTKNILVVICEHDRCAICSNWLATFIPHEIEEELRKKNYDNLYIIDYMASGKDGGPIGFNMELDLIIRKECGLI